MTIICAQCGTEFTPHVKANRKTRFCSRLCYIRDWNKRHIEELRPRLREYQRTHRKKVRLAKRRYNRSVKGQAAHQRGIQPDRNAKFIEQYRNDPYVRAVYNARSKSRKLLIKVRPKVCESCGSTQRVHCHHHDGNPLNMAIENLEWLCNLCHSDQHSTDGPLDHASQTTGNIPDSQDKTRTSS